MATGDGVITGRAGDTAEPRHRALALTDEEYETKRAQLQGSV